MTQYLGNFVEDDTLYVYWSTYDLLGASVAASTAGSIRIYKDGLITEKTTSNGITDTRDFDSVTGVNVTTIDTSNDTGDAGFWQAGHDYFVVLQGATIDGQAVNATLAHFAIENRNENALIGTPSDLAGSGATVADMITDTFTVSDDRLPAALTAGGNMPADALAISGDAAAADNLEAVLDGTGGIDLNLKRLIINNPASNGAVNISSAGAGILVDSSGASGNAIEVLGGNNGIDIQSVAAGISILADQGAVGASGISIGNMGTGDALFLVQTNGSGSVRMATLTDDIVGDVTGNLSGNINTASGTIQTFDALDTAQDAQHSTTQTFLSNIVAALGDWAGTGINNILGAFRALFRSDADVTVPSDINADLGSGAGTADNTTDSLQANQAEHDVTQALIAALNDPTANAIAVEILTVDIDTVEGLAAIHSLCSAILKAISRVEDDGAGHIDTYRTNGSTVHMTQNITTDASADAITGQGVAS